MIIPNIQGGLGNQMFEIAAAIGLAAKYNDTYAVIRGQHFLPLQGRRIENYLNNIFRYVRFIDPSQIEDINEFSVYTEIGHSYKEITKNQKHLLLSGYFQSEKYFSNVKNKIRELYSPRIEDTEYIKKMIPFLERENCISLHIRLGDYKLNPHIHPTISKEYIINALEIIGAYDKIILFSDNKSEALEYISSFVDLTNVITPSLDEDYREIYAISMCDNHIMSNSTFSWWGSWLDTKKSTTVAPKIWFGPSGPQDTQDIYCDGWIKI